MPVTTSKDLREICQQLNLTEMNEVRSSLGLPSISSRLGPAFVKLLQNEDSPGGIGQVRM